MNRQQANIQIAQLILAEAQNAENEQLRFHQLLCSIGLTEYDQVKAGILDKFYEESTVTLAKYQFQLIPLEERLLSYIAEHDNCATLRELIRFAATNHVQLAMQEVTKALAKLVLIGKVSKDGDTYRL